MSVDGKMCRVCLAAQKTSRFNRIFGNNGKIGKQIYELTGLKILEFKQCPALICPKCTGNLQRALELRNSILDNNRHFNEIYKICRFEEYDIEIAAVLTDESDEWTVEGVDEDIEIKKEPNTSSDFTVSNFKILESEELKSEKFEASNEIKQEPEDEDEQLSAEVKIFENPAKDLIEIKTEIKVEPEEIQEYQYDNILDNLQARGSDCSNEIEKSSQQSLKRSRKDNNKLFTCSKCGLKCCSKLDLQEHLAAHKKRKLNESQTINHNVQHKELKPFRCGSCFETFETKYHLQTHLSKCNFKTQPNSSSKT